MTEGELNHDNLPEAARRPVAPKSEEPYVVIGENSVSYLGVELPKGNGGRLVPKAEEFKEEYFYLEGHYQLMREVATAVLLNKPILLEGGTGVYNKTTTIARMCRDLNMNYCKVNFDRETAREDVIGGQTLKVDEHGHQVLEWYDGDLMYAIKNGGVAFLDEYNRQGKLAGIINPIIDAILNGRKEITNPYNENERVTVHPNFRLIAAQNPPGFEEGHEYTDRSQLPAETFGRWMFRKLPIEYSEEEENKLLAGVIGESVELHLPETEFRQTGEGMPVRELAQIPGMDHWRREIITMVRLLEAKSSGAKRELAKGQRQNLYFNPRMIMSTIPQYIARFYSGDINETVKNAFEACVIGMYSAEEDKQKIRLMLDQASWQPPVDSRRRTLADVESTTTKESISDPAWAEAKRLEETLAMPEIPESVKEILSPKETPLSEELKEQIKEAKEIMNKDGIAFFGPDEIIIALGLDERMAVPRIPFSREELERARELGQFLILRLPMSMQKIAKQLGGKVKDSGKLLYAFDPDTGELKEDSWYEGEDFYTTDEAKAGWALVSKDLIPESTSKNYLQQTDLIVEYLKNQVFRGIALPSEFQAAIDEYLSKKSEIETLMSSDWQKAAEILASLQITQLTRQTPAEALYDLAIYCQTTGEKILPSTYTWTSRRDSDGGYFVYVGSFRSDGVLVDGVRPGSSYDSLGVSFSRSR